MKYPGNAGLTSVVENLLFPVSRVRNYCHYQTAVQSEEVAEDIIVSLTTYSARFDTCVHAVRSILRQTCRPRRTELYVTRKEVETYPLPKVLTDLTDAGLEIVTVDDNLGSYGKLVHALGRWPDRTIVTADDDKLYPPNWLAGLIEKHRDMPDFIVCHRARLMNGRSDRWQPYVQWMDCRSSSASAAVFPMGVGGVLYPPGSLHPEVADLHTAKAVAPTSDDIWFKLMAWKAGTRHCQTGSRPKKYASVPNFASVPLHRENLRGGNDVALANLADRFGFVPSAVLKD